ncbi:MAG: carboxypeptidase M32 [Pirellulaceae bacterium]|nr:MAG: carboxypeptidase M32 [Pirellulaceae bacterium]
MAKTGHPVCPKRSACDRDFQRAVRAAIFFRESGSPSFVACSAHVVAVSPCLGARIGDNQPQGVPVLRALETGYGIGSLLEGTLRVATNVQQLWESLRGWAQEIALLESVEAALNWDERTMMPPRGGAYRAEQVSYLSKLIHQKRTDPKAGQWLEELAQSELAQDPSSPEGAAIREARRRYQKAVRLPEKLVEELSRTCVLAQQAWSEARKKSDYGQFQPWLEKIVRLKREQAEALGYTEHRYDALLDDYEPAARTGEITRMLEELRRELVPLLSEIGQSGRSVPTDVLRRHYPQAAQRAFGRWMAERIGFQFDRGRLDETDHPFCTTLGPHDCRITTRYDEHFFPTAFFGILHEAGHGMYEQGLPVDWFGLAPGLAASLGVHESQSRLWENGVGRSLPFWRFAFEHAKRFFPGVLDDVSVEQFYAAVNEVRPSLIRVEADEATYNLHIVIRFELEIALLDNELSVEELPDAWNQKYRSYLGIVPPNDAQGVLQDIHWSSGLIGYFPTYTLGNLYAAQLLEAASGEIGDWPALAARGEFAPLLEWLRTRVHAWGHRYPAAELIEKATGQKPSSRSLIRYLRDKLAPLYGIKN